MDPLRTYHLKPGNILISEENAECYIDMFDLLLTVNSTYNGCKIVPLVPNGLFRQTYHIGIYLFAYDRVNRSDFVSDHAMLSVRFTVGSVDPTALMKEEAKKRS